MKYDQLPRHDELRQLQCDEGEVISIIIGALCNINNNANEHMRKMKIQDQKDALLMIISTGSVNILNNHFRVNDFG